MEVLITNIWNFSVKIIEGRTLPTWILIYKTNRSGLIKTGLVLVSQSSTLSIFFKISFLVLGLCGWWWLGTKATGHQQHQYWLLQFHKWVSSTWTYFGYDFDYKTIQSFYGKLQEYLCLIFITSWEKQRQHILSFVTSLGAFIINLNNTTRYVHFRNVLRFIIPVLMAVILYCISSRFRTIYSM